MRKPVSNWEITRWTVTKAPFHRKISCCSTCLPTILIVSAGNGRCYGDASLGEHSSISCVTTKYCPSILKRYGIFECQSGSYAGPGAGDHRTRTDGFHPLPPAPNSSPLGAPFASDVHGKNHHAEGSFSNHVIGMEVLTGKGLCHLFPGSGQRSLFWATCGGMGLLA